MSQFTPVYIQLISQWSVGVLDRLQQNGVNTSVTVYLSLGLSGFNLSISVASDHDRSL